MTDIPAWIDGVLTPTNKVDVHLRGLRHKAVSVFVTRGSSVLLQQRALEKYHTPGLWANTCCTHPHWQEEPRPCALRRLTEELGITGVNPIYRHTLEYRADVGQNMVEHEVVDVFRADINGELTLTPNRTEVMATRWVELSNLKGEVSANPDKFTPWLRVYLQDHSDKIFGAQL